MDDEEIERLNAELREMLVRRGFAWAVAEAEDGLYPTVTSRMLAHALIEAAEVVTVGIADVEITARDILGADDMMFKADEANTNDRQTDIAPGRTSDQAAFSAGTEPLRGSQRREVLTQLAEQRSVFDRLRRRLDGLD